MPRVPRLERDVATQGYPGTVKALDAPKPQPFDNAPAEKTASTVERVTEAIYLDEKKRADDLVLDDYKNKMYTARREIQTEVANMKGGEAVEAVNHAETRWKETADEYETGLSNATQRANAKAWRDTIGNGMLDAASKHSNAEVYKWRFATLNANNEHLYNFALDNYGNDEAIQNSIRESVENATKFATDEMGLASNDPQLKQITDEIKDKIHRGVIDRHMANGNDTAAKEYYNRKDVNKEILGQNKDDIEKALKEGSTDITAQELSAGVLEEFKPADNEKYDTYEMEQEINKLTTVPEEREKAMVNIHRTAARWNNRVVESIKANKGSFWADYDDPEKSITVQELYQLDSYKALPELDQRDLRIKVAAAEKAKAEGVINKNEQAINAQEITDNPAAYTDEDITQMLRELKINEVDFGAIMTSRDPQKKSYVVAAYAKIEGARKANYFDSDEMKNVNKWVDARQAFTDFLLSKPDATEDEVDKVVESLMAPIKGNWLSRMFGGVTVEEQEAAKAGVIKNIVNPPPKIVKPEGKMGEEEAEEGVTGKQKVRGKIETPSWEEFFAATKKRNPDATEEEIRAFYEEEY